MRRAATPAPAPEAGTMDRSGKAQSARPPLYGLSFADGMSPRSAGVPLAPSVQSQMAARFGRTFDSVRVHADVEAASLADGLGARAYAVGSSIVFGRGQYNPGSPDGQRLIAHELTHVVQQQGQPAASHGSDRLPSSPGDTVEHEAERVAGAIMRGGDAGPIRAHAAPGRAYRFPYETRGVTFSRANIATMAAASYWTNRTGDRYDVTFSQRMLNDNEERDAVLAGLWAINPPATVTAQTVRIVPIAARPPPPAAAVPATAGTPPPPAPVAPPALLYRFTFSPPAAPGGKPQLACELIGFGAGSIPQLAPAPPAGFTGTALSANSSDFPNGRDAYFSSHPEELTKLQNFLATAPPAVDQMLTLTTTNSSGGVTHRTLVHVVRTGTGTSVQLTIDYIAEGATEAVQTVPADYRTRDAVDFEFEKLRRTTLAAGDRLGTVTLPAGMPANEVIPVKLAIQAYFTVTPRPARNTEVDAIIPIGSGSTTALYQLRFEAQNNVTVTRLGIAGTAAGEINTRRIDVTRVNGFPGATASDASLRTWFTSRYPGAAALTTPQPAASGPSTGGAAPANPNTALIAEMNAKISAGVGAPTWFSNNYGITVLDGAALSTRLQTVHSVNATLLGDTKDFDASDFTSLEIAVQTLSTADIANLRGIAIGRKSSAFSVTSTPAPATQYGLTLYSGAGSSLQRTTVYFDTITAADNVLFRGSTAANALPDSSMNMLHELGHGTGYSAGIEAAFNAWRAAHMAQAPAPTWYAASAGAEVFPEFYALFHTDPRALCTNAPQVYAWFAALSNSGTPPAANATFPAPTCP
ncbi:MAG: DUF4157 domain-containing protein [Alphaproteobacteria bacterium]